MDINCGALGCSQKGRQEHLRQKSMTNVIGSKFNLVAFFRGSRGDGHDAGAIDLHVQAIQRS